MNLMIGQDTERVWKEISKHSEKPWRWPQRTAERDVHHGTHCSAMREGWKALVTQCFRAASDTSTGTKSVSIAYILCKQFHNCNKKQCKLCNNVIVQYKSFTFNLSRKKPLKTEREREKEREREERGGSF